MESTNLGNLEMDLKGIIREVSGELESCDESTKRLFMSMLEDAGFIIGEETFRRMVVEFKGYEYLITLTREAISVILRTNDN
jgi:hypothetical protein